MIYKLFGGVWKLKNLGRHILVEFYGCNKSKLDDLKFVERTMVGAA
jgi:S-adenosylmethionine/arginine decarboxylase-like enzyme